MDSAKVGTPPRAGLLTKVRNSMEASNSRTGNDIMEAKTTRTQVIAGTPAIAGMQATARRRRQQQGRQ